MRTASERIMEIADRVEVNASTRAMTDQTGQAVDEWISGHELPRMSEMSAEAIDGLATALIVLLTLETFGWDHADSMGFLALRCADLIRSSSLDAEAQR